VLLCLANQQSADGRSLKSGKIVSTGTCTGPIRLCVVTVFKPILANGAL
jgi:2-keto-4-pentenoate hydratase